MDISEMARRSALGLACLGLALRLAFAPAYAANPDALWQIVHGKCVVTGGAPCLLVDTNAHFALLKDLNGIAQVLLIPTDRITGVEDAALLNPATPNFFADAWAHRDAVEAKLPHPVPRDDLSLAVNASTARSQNQLHIHIDCLSVAAHDALTSAAASVGKTWAPLGVTVAGHQFMARRIDGEGLGDFNPFLAVAETLADPARDMAYQNIVVVGAEFSTGAGATEPGFIALTDRAPTVPMGYGGGEEVQDHACAIAGPKP
jgi:CDP-diacylglycerol pyrophosphatase